MWSFYSGLVFVEPSFPCQNDLLRMPAPLPLLFSGNYVVRTEVKPFENIAFKVLEAEHS